MKVYVFNAGFTAALFHLFGPESYGGLGNVRGKAEEEARRTGESMSDIILRVCCINSYTQRDHHVRTYSYTQEMAIPKGEVIRVPGMPPMYDHEYEPQPVSQSPLACLSYSHLTEIGRIRTGSRRMSSLPCFLEFMGRRLMHVSNHVHILTVDLAYWRDATAFSSIQQSHMNLQQ